MIEPLKDTHTEVDAPRLKLTYSGLRPDPNRLQPKEWPKATAVIRRKYVRGGIRSYCRGHLRFGMLNGSVGYLRVDAFGAYARGVYTDQLQVLQSALDALFRDAEPLRGLVIDVRNNEGGDDPLGVEIASRLTAGRYLAYTKVARNNRDGPLHFTAPQEIWVAPSTRPGFRGNVILLTGPDTNSAGETFTMALMGREPPIARIGLNTQGVFSDVLGRTLPNGWSFGLPNEVYRTKEGKSFDGTGVPPDLRANFFAERLGGGPGRGPR
jgi:C-terminal processing protease CtpA/Prc